MAYLKPPADSLWPPVSGVVCNSGPVLNRRSILVLHLHQNVPLLLGKCDRVGSGIVRRVSLLDDPDCGKHLVLSFYLCQVTGGRFGVDGIAPGIVLLYIGVGLLFVSLGFRRCTGLIWCLKGRPALHLMVSAIEEHLTRSNAIFVPSR